MLMHKCYQLINNLLAFWNQIDARISLGSQARDNSLVDAVIFVVNVSQFYDRDSCLELSLIKILEELNECVREEE